MTKIAAVLNEAKEIIENHLAKEEIAYAILRFLSTSLVFSSHFAEDELYNYITDSFHPGNTGKQELKNYQITVLNYKKNKN
jgi:hypothetical protein